MHNYLDKIDKILLNEISVQSESYIDCIIYVHNLALARDIFKKIQPQLFKIIYEYPFLSAFGVRVKMQDLSRLAQLSQIVYISAQTRIFAQVNKAKEILNVQSLYQKGVSGKNVSIAVLDTGIAPHMDFLMPFKKIHFFKDFINNRKRIYDDNGHGTIISGLISGFGTKSGKKYQGIAPNSFLVSLKCLNEKGQTTTIEMLNAMQWIYDNHRQYNIRIVCMSFGATPTSEHDPLIQGAEMLWNEGITVVSAGGNSGPEYHSIKSPGSSKKIITVGSLDDGRNEYDYIFDTSKLSIPDFSSRGPAFGLYKPDLLASGVDVVSTDNSLGYSSMSGTSVSTPIVAGVCALIIEQYKHSITPDQIKEILLSHTHTLNHDRNTEGFGYLRF